MQMISTLPTSVGKEGVEAVEVSHEGFDRQLGIERRLEVQHGSVGVMSNVPENLVSGVTPNVKLPVGALRLFVKSLDNDPLNDEAFEYQDSFQYPPQ